MKLPTMPNLEGLIRLARQDGVDVRPTLVRVLTDMYVQKHGHTRDEERRFIELATWLLSTVDIATRAAVAKKLAVYPEAPRAVVRRLAADEFEIAEPVLRHSPCLTSEDLLAITVECGWRHAAAIAARELHSVPAAPEVGPETDEQDEAAATEARLIESESDLLASDVQQITAVAAANIDEPARANTPDPSAGRRFLIGSAEQRRQILAEFGDTSSSTSAQTPSAAPEAIAQLEAAALAEKPDDFARGLQHLLLVSRETAQEIVDDPRGEPVMIAARAIGIPSNVLLRILLFLNPAVGQSVERVFDLMDVFTRVTPEAARALVAGWRDLKSGERRSGRYQPLHFDDEAGARRASGDFGRRPAQIPDGRSQPARGADAANSDRRQRNT